MKVPEQFSSQGYVAPLRVMSAEDAADLRARLEAHELAHGPLSKSHRNNPHLLFTWVDKVIRSPSIISVVEKIHGGNLLVWGSTLFIKEPRDPGFVSWHQDSAYWGLEPADVLTAWVAISDSKADNGALQVMPGSHAWEPLEHHDTYDGSNMLSRGQEIAVEVDASQASTLELEPGEMSLHHVRTAHGSQPNRSDRRRIGLAIRYLPTHVRQAGPLRDSATLVSGTDRFENFLPEQRPKVDFGHRERAFHAEVEDRVQSIIMSGAKGA